MPLARFAGPALALALIGAPAAAQDAPAAAQAPAAPPAPRDLLRPGDRLALVGGGLADRLQHDGWLEARLHARAPQLGLTLRNLGFGGDAVDARQRTAGFGAEADWLERAGADVVVGFWGFNESCAGPAGVPLFRAELRDWIAGVRELEIDGAAPRVLLCSPTPYEDLGEPLRPDAAAGNARIEPYVRAMVEVATEAAVPFIDIFHPLLPRLAAADALTIDGVHLNDAGNAELARVVEQAFFGAPVAPDDERLAALRAAVVQKDALWFALYRAPDGNDVYGGRSTLEFDGLTNAAVLQREMEQLEVMAENADRRIRALARGEAPVQPAPLPEAVPVPTNRPGAGPDGAHAYLDGEAAIARMTVGAGLAVNLFADEAQFPTLANPVQMSFDPQGRLWVACWPTYPHAPPGAPRDDKLLVLQDTDGDGRADSAQAFADDLHNPTGFELWGGGVLVAQAPDLLFLQDTDGDGRADRRERLLHGISSSDTHHTANSFVLGPDGALYFQEGIFHFSQIETAWGTVRSDDACVWRFEPHTGRVERHMAYGFLNPHGHVFDAWGQDFVTDGTGNENYLAGPASGWLPEGEKHAPYFTWFAQRGRPAGGTELLSSLHLPPEFDQDLVIANCIGFQGLFRYDVQDDGAGFQAQEREPMLSSTDPNFRPVDVEVGPDGALYVLDWHNALIGHMQHHVRDPSRDHSHGRVYRITAPGRTRSPALPLAGRPVHELVTLLGSPEDRVRYRTRIELSARPSAEVVEAARKWARLVEMQIYSQDVEHELLELLWLQQQHGVLDRALLDRLLGSTDPRARAASVRVLRQMRDALPAAEALDLLRAAVQDENPRVRCEAVVALSFWPSPSAAEAALLARQRPTDRFLDYALGETLRALEPHWRAALASGGGFAADNPAGLAWCLQRLDDAELAGVRPSEPLHAERLARHGLPATTYAQASAALAAARGTRPLDELLGAIDRADALEHGHVDHLLSGLFATLPSLAPAADGTLEAALTPRIAGARRASTRRLAAAARLRAAPSLDPAWDAARTPQARLELLEALPLLSGEPRLQPLHSRVLALLDQPVDGAGVTGRYVRVELPGPRRTLTLAEVLVISGGFDAAHFQPATQSSLAWDGAPSRAVDGNTSGTFADGSQSHTLEDQPDPWWEVDIGRELPLESVVLWNRSEEDGRWLARLDGYVVRVLDAGRNTVFTHAGGKAGIAEHILLASPDRLVRRAAPRAVVATAPSPAAAAAALVARLDEERWPDLVPALRAVPPAAWNPDARAACAEWLTQRLVSRPASDFAAGAGRELLALADELRPHLDAPRAAALHSARIERGPQVVVLRPEPDSLLFDRRDVWVDSRRPIELVFDNTDVMPHNLVVAAPGTLALVGQDAERTASAPDAWERGFVPDLRQVLRATRLLHPGQSETLSLPPLRVNDYPYLCTFPGHWARMNGTLHVVDDLEAALAAAAAAGAGAEAGGAGTDGHGAHAGHGVADVGTGAQVAGAGAGTRAFVKAWTLDDFGGPLRPGRASPERGRSVLGLASCLKCHAIDGVGGKTGPDLREVVPRYGIRRLLQQVLEPSRHIAEGYAAELFFLRGGGVVSGRVVQEDDIAVWVLDDPYKDQPRRVEKAQVEERRVSEVSVMPEGLLWTFGREEIADLVAYMETLRGEAER